MTAKFAIGLWSKRAAPTTGRGLLVCIACTALLAAVVTVPTPALAQAVNAMPVVVPGLRSWTGSTGTFSLTSTSRIIIDSAPTATHTTVHGIQTNIGDVADTLSDELTLLTGFNLSVVTAASSSAGTGDIVLTILNPLNSTIGDEGYVLRVADKVEIEANTNTGIFYAGQTMLQVLGQSDGMRQFPKGVATDYPLKYFRALMLDMGRKYWQVDYLEDLIRDMAWLKMNVFHMHLTEWNAFRLNSDNYPGLGPSSGSYSRDDIDRLEAVAKKHHVVILPEIDMPGHASAMVQYYAAQNPGQSIGFTHSSCSGLNIGVYNDAPNWNINFANSTARQFAKDILSEFVPWFDGPYVHIGADEAYRADDMRGCQEVIDYASANTNNQPGNVLPDFINEMNDHVKSMGKELFVWNGYEHSSTSRTAVDRDVVIYLWDDDETGGTADTDNFLNAGFDIVYTRRHNSPATARFNRYNLYMTAGFALFPTLPEFYNATLSTDADLRGYQLTVWADDVSTFGDSYFEIQMRDARAVVADRLWSAPASTDVNGLRERVVIVGEPLGISLVRAHRGIAKDGWSVLAVSSAGSGEGGAKAFDGRVDTIWRTRETVSSSRPQHLDIDLGESVDVTHLQYVPRYRAATDEANGLPRDRVGRFEFFLSEDGTTWRPVASRSVTQGEPYIITIGLGAVVRGRYLRFRVTGSLSPNHWVSAAELNVFGRRISVAMRDSPLIGPLIGHFKFDEGTGTTVSDSVGTRSGTITGASWIDGRVGSGALRFDGMDDYVQLGSSDVPSDWTAALWVRRKGDNTSAALFGPSDTRLSGATAIKLEQYETSNEVGFTRFGTGDYSFGYVAPLNTWVHLTFVSSSDIMRLYVNGALEGQVIVFQGPSLPLHYIGVVNDSQPGKGLRDYLEADLDEVRIYDRAFTRAEIAHLYATYSFPPHVCPP